MSTIGNSLKAYAKGANMNALNKIIAGTLIGAVLLPGGVAVAQDPTVTPAQENKYSLNKKDLVNIEKAAKWAKNKKVKKVKNCESGGNYKINTGNGYYGAYQFSYQTWKGTGGGKYAKTADKAPRWAQDYMAWKLHRSQGWSPWGCA